MITIDWPTFFSSVFASVIIVLPATSALLYIIYKKIFGVLQQVKEGLSGKLETTFEDIAKKNEKEFKKLLEKKDVTSVDSKDLKFPEFLKKTNEKDLKEMKNTMENLFKDFIPAENEILTPEKKDLNEEFIKKTSPDSTNTNNYLEKEKTEEKKNNKEKKK